MGRWTHVPTCLKQLSESTDFITWIPPQAWGQRLNIHLQQNSNQNLLKFLCFVWKLPTYVTWRRQKYVSALLDVASGKHPGKIAAFIHFLGNFIRKLRFLRFSKHFKWKFYVTVEYLNFDVKLSAERVFRDLSLCFYRYLAPWYSLYGYYICKTKTGIPISIFTHQSHEKKNRQMFCTFFFVFLMIIQKFYTVNNEISTVFWYIIILNLNCWKWGIANFYVCYKAM